MDKIELFKNVTVVLISVVAIFYCILYWKLRKERDNKSHCQLIECNLCGKRIVVADSEVQRICLMQSDFFVVFNGGICCKSCFHDVLILDKEKRNAYLDSLKDV